MLSHQSLGVCEVSDPYPLHCLRNTFFNYLRVFVDVYKHIMYCDVRCCLHIHSVVNVLVMKV